ncbi:hypothetical protein [Streptomyces sp. NPDC002619]|uniref:hypothetical protein n=1 Tax=Streptomyces sp. NPDC002619 TaxID=3364655 RepID=UPI003696096C
MSVTLIRFSRVGDRTRHRVLRATAAAAVVFFGIVSPADTALADPAQHSTETYTGTFPFYGPVTCDGGPTYTQTQNVTITDHLVTTSGQTRHEQITLDVSFTGHPLDSPLPTVTGTIKGTAHGNTHQGSAVEETFNGFTTATYSDGRTVTAKETLHFTVRQDGHTVTSFYRCV